MKTKGVNLFMKTSKKMASALIALGLAFGAVGADMATTEAASVQEIAQINVHKSGSNFQYWNEDSASFKALKAYVEDVTNPTSPNYIPVEDRVCVSDMDGTFYGELAPTYSEWYLYFHRIFNDPTYHPTATEKAYAEELLKAAKAQKISADQDEGEDRAQSYAFEGMTIDEFNKYVDNFFSNAPLEGLTNCTFAEAYYLPMVEVITYLQNNGFNFYVVTGTDRQLVRQALKAPIPSILPDHVIGTDSLPVIERQGWAGSQYFLFNEDGAKDKVMRGPFQFTDNKAGKVQNIAKEIGIHPVIALGNSTSDGSMLNYTLANPKYKSFAMGVCCDDSDRDWGTQAKGDKFKAFCEKYGITPISMAKDWKTIYGYNVEKKGSQTFFTDKGFTK